MCGVFGIVFWGKGRVVTPSSWRLLHMQNSGQDAVGLATANSRTCRPIRHRKEVGRPPSGLAVSPKAPSPWCTRRAQDSGDVGIGHVRYATTATRNERDSQPSLL